MVRPSRNVDAALLAAGLELYPATGVRGLSVRRVADRAGVNLGMFHYHFKTKDVFLRTLFQQLYDGMFEALELAAAHSTRPPEALRAALIVLATFARDNRMLLRRLLTDALGDEPLAVEFAATNLPRHVGVIMGLVKVGMDGGALRRLHPAQALAFIAGAVGAPILLGSAITDRPAAAVGLRAVFDEAVLSDAALAERVDLVVAALRVAPSVLRRR